MEINKDIILFKLFNLILKEKNKDKKADLILSFAWQLNYISYKLIETDVSMWLDLETREEYFKDCPDVSTPELFLEFLKGFY